MNKKYNIVYADPPWRFSSGIRSSRKIRGRYQYYTPDTTIGDGRYPTMSVEEIKSLGKELTSILADDCVLFLWTTDAHLPAALEVIKAWGFTYKTIAFIWNTRGKAHKLIKSHKVRQLVEAPRDKKIHSKKPDEVRRRIVELLGDIPRIELFARESVKGWDVWGNEVEHSLDLFAPQ